VVEAPVDARDVLVDDWVDGVDLARLLVEQGRPGMPVASVLDWVSQAAEALTVLHRDGGVHGDVRPANLVLDETGRIVLVGPHGNGKPANTAAFRPPEVDAGAAPDHAADVYGLAATTFALLTGVAPTAVRPNAAAGPGGRLESVLRDVLAADPEHRPGTPTELVERLRAEWDDSLLTGVGTVIVIDLPGDVEGREDAPRSAMRRDLRLAVDRAVEDHDGRSLDPTLVGDAAVSLFTDATPAVRAAVALQRELRSSPELLLARAGLASGELTDSSGVEALVEQAIRVKDLAGPGEILLAGSTASLVRPTLADEMRLIDLTRDGDDAGTVVAIATVGVASPPDPSRSPYPGLVSFGRNDADLFFGREKVIAQCLEMLRAERFVAIVGTSGSGKSSLIHAGLLPWLPDVVLLRPGEHPQQSLADARAADRPNAVLVVDQLEEVATLCRGPDERSAFIDAILDHPGGLAVALRADRYGEFAQFDEFAQLLASCQVLLGPLDDDEIHRAVSDPARRCGLAVEDGLPELVSAELPPAPGTLPLLGHALRETWRHREDAIITVAGYRATGGVGSAIAETGERAYAALDERDQAVARRLLPRMADIRFGADTRRWVSDAEVAEVHRSRGRGVLAAMTAAGLVVVDHDRSTVAHEAVLTAWPRLADWIAQERAALQIRRGRRRERSRVWLTVGAAVVALTALVIGIVAFAERDAAIEERDAAQLASLVADAQAAAGNQPDAAMLLAAEAHTRSPTPETAGVLVDALLARPSAHALLQGSASAVQALAVGGGTVVTASGNEVRLWTEGGWRQTDRYEIGEDTISDLAVSDDGQTLLAAIPGDHALVAVERETGESVADPVDFGAMSPMSVVSAGERVLILVDDRVGLSTAFRIEQRDLRTLDLAGPSLVPPAGRPEDIVISDDGSRAAITTTDGAVWLADLGSGIVALGAAAPVSETDVGIDDLAWHDDLLVAGRADGSVDAWRYDAGNVLTALGRFLAGGSVTAVAAGCDGSCLAAGTADGRVVAWRIGAEQIPLDAPAHNGRVDALEFTTDDAFVVSAGSDHVTAVHALDGSLTLAPTVVPGGAPARGAYGADGAIFSGADDAERGRIIRRLTDGQEAWRADVKGAVTWLAATDRRVVALVAPAAEPVRFMVLDAASGDVLLDESLNATRAAGAVSPDGSMAVLATRDAYGSSFVEVDLGILAISEPTDVSERVTAVAISPDGDRVVTGHATGDIAVRGLESFTPEHRTMPRVDDSIEAAGFTPDGETVVAGGSAGVVHVLDATTLEPRFSALEGHRRGISSVASNDDFILAASADGTVRIWDLAGGGALGGPIPTGGITAPSIAMNSNGDRALVQGDRGLLELIVDEDEWVRLACSIAGGELTEDERASYGLGRSANACGPG
jgi:WD40 repeat protein